MCVLGGCGVCVCACGEDEGTFCRAMKEYTTQHLIEFRRRAECCMAGVWELTGRERMS